MAKPFRIEGKSGWWVRYTDEFGKRRKKSFDTYDHAEKALALETARVIEVKRGLRDPRRRCESPSTPRRSKAPAAWRTPSTCSRALRARWSSVRRRC